jgi:hypothetical protein
MPDQSTLCQARLVKARSGGVWLGEVRPGHSRSGWAILGHVRPDVFRPGCFAPG